jgi:hypothetical protein
MFESEIREWMAKHNLDVTKAAAALDIAYPTLTVYLGGRRPGPETLEKITEKMRAYDQTHHERQPAA